MFDLEKTALLVGAALKEKKQTVAVAESSSGGLICADNTLWSGAVVDPDVHDPDTEAIRRFNDHVAADARTRQVIVPIGDGLTLIRRA